MKDWKIFLPKEISSFGVLATPGLVINDKVKVQGRIPSLSEIKELIKSEMAGE